MKKFLIQFTGIMLVVLLVGLPTRLSRAALIAHWNLDQGSGQAVTDSVGTNHGTLGVNGGTAADDPTWTTSAKIGSHALSFDGGDWVNFGNVLNMGSNDFTVSIWFQPNSLIGTDAANSGRLLQKRGTGPAGGTPGWQLAVQRIGSSSDFRLDNLVWDDGASNTPAGRVGWISSNGVANDAPAPGMTGALNQWHHLTSVFDNTNNLWSLYLNGVLAQSVTVSNTMGSVNNGRVLSLGAGSDNGTTGLQFFNGILDDPGIFSGALGASYAGAIYSLGNNATLNYDLSSVNDLFGVFEEMTTEVTLGGLTWTRATGLSSPIGQVTEINGDFYLTLDGSGNGLTTFQALSAAAIPEPSSLVALTGLLLVMANRKRKPRRAVK